METESVCEGGPAPARPAEVDGFSRSPPVGLACSGSAACGTAPGCEGQATPSPAPCRRRGPVGAAPPWPSSKPRFHGEGQCTSKLMREVERAGERDHHPVVGAQWMLEKYDYRSPGATRPRRAGRGSVEANTVKPLSKNPGAVHRDLDLAPLQFPEPSPTMER